MTRRMAVLVLIVAIACQSLAQASSQPIRTKRGMVISASAIASDVGADVLKDGGTAIDAAVATAFAHGGDLSVRRQHRRRRVPGLSLGFGRGGRPTTSAKPRRPARRRRCSSSTASTTPNRHHNSHVAVGVPGTVAGLHMAWKEHGKLPWRRLVDPAIKLARDGFPVSEGLARSLAGVLDSMKPYPASVAQFSKKGVPYEAGEILKQPDLARTLQRIAAQGPDGFYKGETAELIEKEMKAHGGLDHARGPGGLSGEETRADPRHLPRLRRAVDAADQLGRRRARSRC